MCQIMTHDGKGCCCSGVWSRQVIRHEQHSKRRERSTYATYIATATLLTTLRRYGTGSFNADRCQCAWKPARVNTDIQKQHSSVHLQSQISTVSDNYFPPFLTSHRSVEPRSKQNSEYDHVSRNYAIFHYCHKNESIKKLKFQPK